MSRRDPRTRDRDGDVPESAASSDSVRGPEGTRFRDRVRSRAGGVVSVAALGVALLLALGGVVFVGRPVPLPFLGDQVGIAVAGFVYGAVGRARHYVETGLAGACVGAGTALAGAPLASLAGAGLPVAVSAVGGAVAGLVGHYLGRDLRDGMTRDL